MLALQREREFRKQARDVIKARLLAMKSGHGAGLRLDGDSLGEGAAIDVNEGPENERANPEPLAPVAPCQVPPESV